MYILTKKNVSGLLSSSSFTAIPGQGEADLRMVYTAFAICAMLDEWSAIDVPRAIAFIKRCMVRVYFLLSFLFLKFFFDKLY